MIYLDGAYTSYSQCLHNFSLPIKLISIYYVHVGFYTCIVFSLIFLLHLYSLWQDGVLTSLLLKDISHDPGSAIKGSAHWFVLEGGLSTGQMDSLLSYISPESALTLSNGRTIQLSDSVRFIFEVSYCSVF